MKTRVENVGACEVGRVHVEVELTNWRDIVRQEDGNLPADEVRRVTVSSLIDPGATRLVLPKSIVEQLGLPLGKKIKVGYADGRSAQRHVVEGGYLQLLDRHGTFTAIVEPKRTTALIGAIVLEDLDLLVDCKGQQVLPRDPHGEFFEIE